MIARARNIDHAHVCDIFVTRKSYLVCQGDLRKLMEKSNLNNPRLNQIQ
jgi:hypothetical protein